MSYAEAMMFFEAMPQRTLFLSVTQKSQILSPLIRGGYKAGISPHFIYFPFLPFNPCGFYFLPPTRSEQGEEGCLPVELVVFAQSITCCVL